MHGISQQVHGFNVEGSTIPPCIPGPIVPLGALDAWSINYALDYTCDAFNPGTGLDLEFSGGAGAVHNGPYAKPFGFGGGLTRSGI